MIYKLNNFNNKVLKLCGNDVLAIGALFDPIGIRVRRDLPLNFQSLRETVKTRGQELLIPSLRLHRGSIAEREPYTSIRA